MHPGPLHVLPVVSSALLRGSVALQSQPKSKLALMSDTGAPMCKLALVAAGARVQISDYLTAS